MFRNKLDILVFDELGKYTGTLHAIGVRELATALKWWTVGEVRESVEHLMRLGLLVDETEIDGKVMHGLFLDESNPAVQLLDELVLMYYDDLYKYNFNTVLGDGR